MMAFDLRLDGTPIQSAAEFHEAVKAASGIEWYGENLDALWDLLISLVEPPIRIVWPNADFSRSAMGEDFDRIVAVIEEAQSHYRSSHSEAEFKFELETQ